jgi:hypothetical protein
MKWFDDEIEKEFDRMRQRMEKMLGSSLTSWSGHIVRRRRLAPFIGSLRDF